MKPMQEATLRVAPPWFDVSNLDTMWGGEVSGDEQPLTGFPFLGSMEDFDAP